MMKHVVDMIYARLLLPSFPTNAFVPNKAAASIAGALLFLWSYAWHFCMQLNQELPREQVSTSLEFTSSHLSNRRKQTNQHPNHTKPIMQLHQSTNKTVEEKKNLPELYLLSHVSSHRSSHRSSSQVTALGIWGFKRLAPRLCQGHRLRRPLAPRLGRPAGHVRQRRHAFGGRSVGWMCFSCFFVPGFFWGGFCSMFFRLVRLVSLLDVLSFRCICSMFFGVFFWKRLSRTRLEKRAGGVGVGII